MRDIDLLRGLKDKITTGAVDKFRKTDQRVKRLEQAEGTIITTRTVVRGGGGGGGTPASGNVATDTIWDAKGDLAAGTGADTALRLAVGADDTILMADAAQATGLKWVASGTPSTQAFGDAAAVGTADTFTRGDHKHAMPADPVTAHVAAGDPHTGYRLESVDLFVSKTFTFTVPVDALATGALVPEIMLAGESGEHGTLSFVRAKAVCVTAGTGTNTILVEVDDNPGFTSATTIATLNLGTSTEADDATEDAAWTPTTNVFVRARCTAVGATPPDKVTVFLVAKERAEAY